MVTKVKRGARRLAEEWSGKGETDRKTVGDEGRRIEERNYSTLSPDAFSVGTKKYRGYR